MRMQVRIAMRLAVCKRGRRSKVTSTVCK